MWLYKFKDQYILHQGWTKGLSLWMRHCWCYGGWMAGLWGSESGWLWPSALDTLALPQVLSFFHISIPCLGSSHPLKRETGYWWLLYSDILINWEHGRPFTWKTYPTLTSAVSGLPLWQKSEHVWWSRQETQHPSVTFSAKPGSKEAAKGLPKWPGHELLCSSVRKHKYHIRIICIT